MPVSAVQQSDSVIHRFTFFLKIRSGSTPFVIETTGWDTSPVCKPHWTASHLAWVIVYRWPYWGRGTQMKDICTWLLFSFLCSRGMQRSVAACPQLSLLPTIPPILKPETRCHPWQRPLLPPPRKTHHQILLTSLLKIFQICGPSPLPALHPTSSPRSSLEPLTRSPSRPFPSPSLCCSQRNLPSRTLPLSLEGNTLQHLFCFRMKTRFPKKLSQPSLPAVSPQASVATSLWFLCSNLNGLVSSRIPSCLRALVYEGSVYPLYTFTPLHSLREAFPTS